MKEYAQFAIDQLHRYIEDCKKLRYVIRYLISDLEYLQDGGKIIYAVDFSELYSYLIPQDLTVEFKIVSNYELRNAELIQRVVLHNFFFGQNDKHVLLAPYAAELEGFIARLKEGAYHDIIDRCLRIFEETQDLTRSELFSKINHLTKKSQVDPEDFEAIYNLLRKNAPSLFNLIIPRWEEPLKLLKELFNAKVFQNATDLGVPLIEVRADDEVVHKWYEELLVRRGVGRIGATLVDANAIGIITHLNTLLQDRHTRVLLMTRSKTMHQLASGGFERDYADTNFTNLLRHPLSFYFMFGLKRRSMASLTEELRNELETIDFFLGTLEKNNQSGISRIDDFYTEIVNHLINISQIWESEGVLNVATYGFPMRGLSHVQQDTLVKSLAEFFRNINDSKALRAFLIEKMNELHERLRSEHQYLGLYTEVDNVNNDLKASITLRNYPEKGKYVLGADRQAMPYSLQFYSEDAGALLIRFGEQESYSLDDALPILIYGFKEESIYERLLAMAFILGTLSKWREAESYCEEALKDRYTQKDIPPYEGYFFLAICKRKYKPSIERHREALELLEKASSTKKEWKNDREYLDPRYIHERGVQILKCRFGFSEALREDQTFPPLEEGLRSIELALDKTEDDPYLKVQAMNNVLYYYLRTGSVDNKEQLERILGALLKQQLLLESDIKYWPGALLDTIALAKWKIGGANSLSSIEEIKNLFNLALQSPHLERMERNLIQSHLDEFIISTLR